MVTKDQQGTSIMKRHQATALSIYGWAIWFGFAGWVMTRITHRAVANGAEIPNLDRVIIFGFIFLAPIALQGLWHTVNDQHYRSKKSIIPRACLVIWLVLMVVGTLRFL